MPADYRHLITDVRTGKVLSDAVTLNVASYARRLNNPTSCSATLDLSDPAVRTLSDPITATEPRRSALWIIRDQAVVWGGIIWTRRYRSADHNLDLGIETFESYFARRVIRADLTYTQRDQHDILFDLVRESAQWGAMPDAPTGPKSGDIGVVLTYPPPRSGQLRDRAYYGADRATYLERMQQLGEVINGPDFTFQPGWSASGTPQVSLLVGTPLGDVLGTTVVEFPGDLRNYSWPEDGGNSANFWTAIGDRPEGVPDTSPPVMVSAHLPWEWDPGGLPLLEDKSQHQGVINPQTLYDYCHAALNASGSNRIIPEATLRLQPGSGLPNLGDTVRLRLTDPYRFPADPVTGAPGIIAPVRITGWTVNLSEAEDETLSCTFQGAD